MLDIEKWSFRREEAAQIVGLTFAQLSNLQARYKPQLEVSEGQGKPTLYKFFDLVKLACVVQMINDGFHGSTASNALRTAVPIRALLHGNGSYGLTPDGSGNLINVDHADAPSRYQLNVDVIAERLFPAFAAAVEGDEHYPEIDLPARRVALSQFKEKLDEIIRTARSA